MKRVGRQVGAVAALRTQPAGLRGDGVGVDPRCVQRRKSLGQRCCGGRAGASAGAALGREGDPLDPAVRDLERDPDQVAACGAACSALEATRNRLTRVG